MQEAKRELTLTRNFDAPIQKVWKYWTDTSLLQQWWGPNGVTNPTCVFEVKPGGKIDIVMLAGEELGPMKGQRWPMKGEVKEVEAPNKLVFTGQAIVNDEPVLENLVTVNLVQEGDKTKLTIHISVTKTTPEAAGPLQGMEMGWNQQLDKLVKFVEKD